MFSKPKNHPLQYPVASWELLKSPNAQRLNTYNHPSTIKQFTRMKNRRETWKFFMPKETQSQP
ncbi:hypothetical protein HanXRQr2_Chr16g0757011 [Helianthus annuus]|uniref:Uncharacterized protein n=1 Tax=Helianthus annuus TaxID=4232 RepID=A0A9K3DTX2_HELAN|nr:hypothetical protein HanXRQr2_Chr16g0757011 [Helianthus annuus]